MNDNRRVNVTHLINGSTTSGFLRWYAAELDCGHRHYSGNYQPFSNLSVGDAVACQECAAEADDLRRAEDFDYSAVAYARYKTWCRQSAYYLYRRDKTSPTGVLLADTFRATADVEAVLRSKRLATVSPTERVR